MAEISDQELARLRSLEGLVNKLEGDPRSARLVEEAVKLHHPEVRTQAETLGELTRPMLEPMQQTLAAVQASLTKMEERDAAAAQAATERGLETTFGSLQAKHGFTEDGITRIKQIMVDRNVADPEAAAALFLQQNPPKPTEAPAWQPAGWDISSAGGNPAADMKELFENEDAWADKTAAATLNEIRVGKAA